MRVISEAVRRARGSAVSSRVDDVEHVLVTAGTGRADQLSRAGPQPVPVWSVLGAPASLSRMTMRVTESGLELRFSPSEKVLGLVRDTDVPFSAVRGVDVVANGLDAPTGLRAPGYSWPWRRKIGTWRRRGHKSLVDVRRHQPAVRVRLEGHRYDELVVGADHAAQLAAEVRARIRGGGSRG